MIPNQLGFRQKVGQSIKFATFQTKPKITPEIWKSKLKTD